MINEQAKWSPQRAWELQSAPLEGNADLVLAFGSTDVLEDPRSAAAVAARYPRAYVCGCSTAGEILGECVYDDTLCVTAVKFEGTTIRPAQVAVQSPEQSRDAGRRLGESLPHDGLVHAFVLSDGLCVNGTELVRGLHDALPPRVTVTGGLAGDGTRFGRTLVWAGGQAAPRTIVIIGFYGSRLAVGYGSMGGWDPFGPERTVTRSHANVLYELDGQSALALYKQYLGDHAGGLPASGLLFPLSLRIGAAGERLVRTILAVNERDQSMTFAGDIPEAGRVQLMKANFDRLIDGASGAARSCMDAQGDAPELAILISCVGRRLVLQQRIEEELECVRGVLGAAPALTGFYSYGELCPLPPAARCELHNQTMTVTTFSER